MTYTPDIMEKYVKYNEKYARRMFRNLFQKEAASKVDKMTVNPKAYNVGNYNNIQKYDASSKLGDLTGRTRAGNVHPALNYSSPNYQQYILNANTGKYVPYSHLFNL